jgi:hypothetical protein
MDIDDLQDVRAIIASPHGGHIELAHPNDLDGVAASYGGVTVYGAVGFRRSECLVLGGVLRLTVVHVRTIDGMPLPAGLQDDLRAEYRELVPTDA